MNGDKKISFSSISNVSPFMQLYEFILIAGVDDLNVRKIVLESTTQFQSNGEGVLFLHTFVGFAARVVTAVSSVNDNFFYSIFFALVFVGECNFAAVR